MSFLIKDPLFIDFETYYDDTCSAKKNDKKDWVGGAYHYTRHPKFYAYMVSYYDLVTGERGVVDGVENVKKFVDTKCRNRTLGAHNAGFEENVCSAIIPGFKPLNMVDTADLSQYLQAPRDLAGASKYLLGVNVEKAMRDYMRGKHYHELPDDIKRKMRDYALTDVVNEADIFKMHSDKWPEIEMWLSDHTRRQNQRGVYIDTSYLEEQLEKVLRIREGARRKIPWAQEEDSKPLSAKNLALWCREVGIEPPASLAEDSEECVEWENKYGEKYPVVNAMRDFRKSNTYWKKLHLIERLLRPDGTIPLGLKYFGAPHTGRWSSAGFNIQSLPRPDIEPCDDFPEGGFTYADIRGCICPKSGNVFIPSDLSNIEARCLPWLSGDTDLLSQMAQGIDIYEIFARRALEYTDPRPLKKADKPLRFVSKTCVLGLGFQAGRRKFQWMLENMLKPQYLERARKKLSVPVYSSTGRLVRLDDRPETNAEVSARLVNAYRKANAKTEAMWYDLDNNLRQSLVDNGQFEIQIPSGKVIRYFNLSQREYTDFEGNVRMEVIGSTCRGDAPVRLYGGKLAENITQATAREVFARAIYNMNKKGIYDAFHAHDEAIPEVPKEDANDAKVEIERIMSETPEWLQGCPIACETQITDRYCK